MNRYGWLHIIPSLVLTVVLLVGCGTPAVTSQPTSVSPTPTFIPKPKIKTPIGTLAIVEVMLIDRDPPNCDLKDETAAGCLVVPKEGYRILKIVLEGTDGGDPDTIALNLPNEAFQNAHVIASDGSRGNCVTAGLSKGVLLADFTVLNAAHDFELVWGDNPPINLGK